MEDLKKFLDYIVGGFGALFSITGGNLFGIDLGFLAPFMVVGLSGFIIWRAYTRCSKTCGNETKNIKK